jgi:hypothetical protein
MQQDLLPVYALREMVSWTYGVTMHWHFAVTFQYIILLSGEMYPV